MDASAERRAWFASVAGKRYDAAKVADTAGVARFEQAARERRGYGKRRKS